MPWSNQTRHETCHETWKCKFRLDASVFNNKQKWIEDKCRCECREELINKERCGKGLSWNPSYCTCDTIHSIICCTFSSNHSH